LSIMGLDYGSKTVGVSCTDALGITVQPIETIQRKSENKLRRTCARLETLIRDRKVTLVVLGRPLNMDETPGERVEQCEIFKTMLERRTGIPVVWQDERLTTVESGEILGEGGVKKKDRKKVIDQVAACLILEEYINGKDQVDG